MKKLIIALAVLVLAGCGTSPVPSNEAVSVPQERVFGFQKNVADFPTLIVTRDNGWLAGGGCFVAILIDGKVVARIGTGETVKFYVEPGRKIIGISGDEKGGGLCSAQFGQQIKESSVELKSNEVQRFRISGDTNSGLDIRPTTL
ncbi:hypothetical protein B4900_17825 [Yersinia rohdei]|nr:hypothetical protein B4900_17825 [Yersinia rohdei]